MKRRFKQKGAFLAIKQHIRHSVETTNFIPLQSVPFLRLKCNACYNFHLDSEK
jgi:hypothetical protein